MEELETNLGIEINFLYDDDGTEDADGEYLGVFIKNQINGRVELFDRQGLQELIDGLQQMANQLPL